MLPNNKFFQRLKKTTLYKIYNSFRIITLKIKQDKTIVSTSIENLKTNGINSLIEKFKNYYRIQEINSSITEQYQTWIKNNWPTPAKIKEQIKTQNKFKYRPKISIITPIYNPDPKWLVKCIESVISQSYNNWEFCLADDRSTNPEIKKILKKYQSENKKIKIIFRPENGHISKASNSALTLATGEFIGLLDHDDELAPNALFEVVKTLNADKNIDFIYSDEDKINPDGKHVDPFFKPNWSPDMFMSYNYLCHFVVIRKKIIDQIGGFRIGYEGSQDYDLFLRATEKTNKIHHIDTILYSWRKTANSTSARYSVKNYADDASIKSLSDALKRKNIKGKVQHGLIDGTFRVKYKIIGNPLISIIIPTKDKVNFLKRCISSVLNLSTYDNYEILIIDTGSFEKKTKKYYKMLKNNKKIKILNWKEKFNYSSVNNFAANQAKGDYLLFLNNDTEVITPDWIESMLEHAQRKEVGAVGAKLLYPNGKIQHAGVILGIKGGEIKRGIAGHIEKMFEDKPLMSPILNSKDIVRNFSAVTAACLMISQEKFFEVNGFGEKFRIAFNDIDLNLKLVKKDYLNVYTPFAKLYHHESISVGTPQQGNRDINEFNKEIELMIVRWDNLLEHDPYYNKNLDLKHENFNLNI